MFYVYTIFIPLIIAVISYLIIKPSKNKKYLNFTLVLEGVLFIYAFVMYFLEMEDIVAINWIFPTLIFFLIPALVLSLIVKLILFLIKKNKD